MLFLCASLAVLASSVSASCKYVLDYSTANQALSVDDCNYASIFGYVTSFKYTCMGSSTIKKLSYNGSSDCSGSPTTETFTSAQLTFDCAATENCGKSIQEKYPCGCSSSCMVKLDYTFVNGICVSNSSEDLGTKGDIDCDGNKATIYTYNSSDCSGSPIDEEVTESGCITIGTGDNATQIDFAVCGGLSPSPSPSPSPGSDSCKYVLDFDDSLPFAVDSCNSFYFNGSGMSFSYTCLDSHRVKLDRYTSTDCTGSSENSVYTHANASFDCSATKTCGELLEQKTPCGCKGTNCAADVKFYIAENTCISYPDDTSAKFDLDCSGKKGTRYSYTSSDCSGSSSPDVLTGGCLKEGTGENATEVEIVICDASESSSSAFSCSVIALLALFFSLQIFS